MRVDKLLWCARLFGSRSLATTACDRGRVRVNGSDVKPSRAVSPGDELAVRTPPIWRSFRVIAIPASRVGAKLVPQFLQETTPIAELEKAELAHKVRSHLLEPGAGRPTKRDRRHIERFTAGSDD